MTRFFKSSIPSSQITPEAEYWARPRGQERLSRRQLLRAGALAMGSLALAACNSAMPTAAPSTKSTNEGAAPAAPAAPDSKPDTGFPALSKTTDEMGDPLNTFEQITNYNNFYEFTTEKEGVAPMAANWKPNKWSVTIGGMVKNPKTFDIDDLRKKFTQEERVYRLRCVEGWSMVIPWNGFSLAALLKEVEPTSTAKFVRFESINDPDNLPGQKMGGFSWPYVEGLRLDEAMNDLTLLATGVYGKLLPPQSGAPIRLAVPWKYGFKSAKSIVKIDLVDQMPTSLWMNAAPDEYGFYSNVNPERPHPRWSQASERRIGETSRRRTIKFNGYADKVATLYNGMDLVADY